MTELEVNLKTIRNAPFSWSEMKRYTTALLVRGVVALQFLFEYWAFWLALSMSEIMKMSSTL